MKRDINITIHACNNNNNINKINVLLVIIFDVLPSIVRTSILTLAGPVPLTVEATTTQVYRVFGCRGPTFNSLVVAEYARVAPVDALVTLNL